MPLYENEYKKIKIQDVNPRDIARKARERAAGNLFPQVRRYKEDEEKFKEEVSRNLKIPDFGAQEGSSREKLNGMYYTALAAFSLHTELPLVACGLANTAACWAGTDETNERVWQWRNLLKYTTKASVGASSLVVHKDKIKKTLAEMEGHMGDAAKKLGVSRGFLKENLELLKIDIGDYRDRRNENRENHGKKAIVDALRQTKGNQGQAARLLGITTGRLLQLIKAGQIDVLPFIKQELKRIKQSESMREYRKKMAPERREAQSRAYKEGWAKRRPSKEEVEQVMRETQGNRTKASERLGVHWQTLNKILHDYGIDPRASRVPPMGD